MSTYFELFLTNIKFTIPITFQKHFHIENLELATAEPFGHNLVLLCCLYQPIFFVLFGNVWHTLKQNFNSDDKQKLIGNSHRTAFTYTKHPQSIKPNTTSIHFQIQIPHHSKQIHKKLTPEQKKSNNNQTRSNNFQLKLNFPFNPITV